MLYLMKPHYLGRIRMAPTVCHGKPCIRNTRILVSNILNLMAHGADEQEILSGYPQLEKEDIRAALEYAEARINEEEVIVL